MLSVLRTFFQMRSIFAVAAGLLFAHGISAIKCSSDETLKQYDISRYPLVVNVERDTPPSRTDERWYLGVCEENGSDRFGDECGSRDALCGTTHVLLSGKEPLLTQVIDFPQNIQYEVEEVQNGFSLRLKGTRWGSGIYDALIGFSCDPNKSKDEMTFDKWQGSEVKFSVSGPSGCLKRDDDNNGGHGHDDNDGESKKQNGSSWFTWLFIYALLFTIIYLGIISFANTRGGSFQDFKEEFMDRAKQLITSLPEFLKEVATKVFGGSSSPRGGYSAV